MIAAGSHPGNASDAVFSTVYATPEPVVAALLRREYGIEPALSRLVAERDENFHVRATDGREYLLKVTNPAEDPRITAFHTGAFRHIAARDPALLIPHLVPAINGRLELSLEVAGTPTRIARLFTYLPGIPLYKAERTGRQRAQLGRTLARLDRALTGYRCDVPDYRLAWDLQHAAERRPLIDYIDDPARRALAARCLDTFEQLALPALGSLRRQVIHNDFQPYNVLVAADDPAVVSGIIDFGDMVEAPLVDELAVACAYHVDGAAGPLDQVVELVRGYHEVLPLEPREIAILYDLIATRLLLTVSITNWRAARQPENSAYILRNAPAAWRSLERFASLSRDEARRQLAAACQQE